MFVRNAGDDDRMWKILLLTFLLGIFAVQDLRKKEISVRLLAAALAAGTAVRILSIPFSAPELLLSLMPGAVLTVTAVFSKGRIGPGDGLVFLVTGLFLTADRNLGLMFLSFVIGAVTAGILLALNRKKRGEAFAFLPCVFCAQLGILAGEMAWGQKS